MAEMLIDGAKLDACNTAEADAIRAKTGGTDPIPYDYANNKGFADAIAGIPSGGGGGSGGGVAYATFANDNGTWSCDKTYAELKAAYDSGKLLIAMYTGQAELMNYREMGGQSAFLSSFLFPGINNGAVVSLKVDYVGILSNETLMAKTGIKNF